MRATAGKGGPLFPESARSAMMAVSDSLEATMNTIDRRRLITSAGALTGAAFLGGPARAASEREGFGDLYAPPTWHPGGGRVLEQPPPAIASDGRLRLGLFTKPCRSMNLTDSRVYKGRERRWWGGPKLMEWVGFGIAHEAWYFGMIIMDLKMARFAAVYALDRESGRSFSHDAPGSARDSAVSATLWSGRTFMDKKGFHMLFTHDLENGRHGIEIDIAGKGGKPAVEMRLDLAEDMSSFQPLVVSMPIYPAHHLYTHKTMMEAGGSARVGGDELDYDPARSLAALDEFKSYWPIPRRWTWGTALGVDTEGNRVAFNMADYYVRDQDQWNENCLWVGGEIGFLGAAKWSLDESDPDKPWRLEERSGRLKATFYPEGGKIVDLGPAFKYYQKCGRYEGFFIDGQGRRREFENLYGPGENGRIG